MITQIVRIENTKYQTIAKLAHFVQRLKLTTIDVTQITDTYTHTAATLYIVGNIAYYLPDIIMENLIR